MYSAENKRRKWSQKINLFIHPFNDKINNRNLLSNSAVNSLSNSTFEKNDYFRIICKYFWNNLENSSVVFDDVIQYREHAGKKALHELFRPGLDATPSSAIEAPLIQLKLCRKHTQLASFIHTR